MTPPSRSPRGYTPLFQRVAATNAILLVAACAVTILVVSPHKLSSFAAGEALVLLAALVLVAGINLYLLRRALGPLEALTALARRVDLTRPGQRVPVSPYGSEARELAVTFNEMLERLEIERRDSTRRVLAAQESERLRISRELHDEVGQTLTAVLLQLGRSAKRAGPGARARAARGAGDGPRDARGGSPHLARAAPGGARRPRPGQRAGGSERALRPEHRADGHAAASTASCLRWARRPSS